MVTRRGRNAHARDHLLCSTAPCLTLCHMSLAVAAAPARPSCLFHTFNPSSFLFSSPLLTHSQVHNADVQDPCPLPLRPRSPA